MKSKNMVVCLTMTALLAGGCHQKQADGPGVFPPTQVVAVEARVQSVSETLSLVGTVAADEMVEIKAETEGVVQTINFEEGQPVEAGRLLLGLDETKLAAAVSEAEASFKLSRANFSRSEQLLKDRLISQQEFDQAAATFAVNQAGLELKRRELKDTRIYAPFAGVTGARSVSPGQVISKNSTLTWLVALNPVKVEVNVPERFLSQLKAGQTLEIGVATFPGRKFKGQVYFIAPFVDPATRTALVKARIANPDFELKPGMFANLDLTLQIRDHAIVIPEPALMLSGDRTMVFVVDKNLVAQLRDVNIGVRLAGQVEILKGLGDGDRVIVEGLQKTRPGGPVKLAGPEASVVYQGGKTNSARQN